MRWPAFLVVVDRESIYRPVVIHSNVWVGGGAILLFGVEIAEGATIGAGNVVTLSILSHCVAVGNLCRVIRQLDSE